MRWLVWLLLVPQPFLVAGWLGQSGWPQIDYGAVLCLFLLLYAEPVALPGLLLGAAVGRGLIDEASVPLQLLILGVPLAVLMPLRRLFYRDQLWWQVLATSAFAVAIPKLAGLFGVWFDQPSASAQLSWMKVLWTGLFGPVALFFLRLLPPFSVFAERRA
jgi:hypothetical protein